jgi:hypothetical protein
MGEPLSKRRAVPSRRSKTKVVNYADGSSGSASSDSDTGPSDHENMDYNWYRSAYPPTCMAVDYNR